MWFIFDSPTPASIIWELDIFYDQVSDIEWRNIEQFVVFSLQILQVEIPKYLHTRLSVCWLLECQIYSGMIFS